MKIGSSRPAHDATENPVQEKKKEKGKKEGRRTEKKKRARQDHKPQGGGVYFGPEFEYTIHHGREGMTLGWACSYGNVRVTQLQLLVCVREGKKETEG